MGVEPLHGEKKCAVCGHYQGQHLGTDGTCPTTFVAAGLDHLRVVLGGTAMFDQTVDRSSGTHHNGRFELTADYTPEPRPDFLPTGAILDSALRQIV